MENKVRRADWFHRDVLWVQTVASKCAYLDHAVLIQLLLQLLAGKTAQQLQHWLLTQRTLLQSPAPYWGSQRPVIPVPNYLGLSSGLCRHYTHKLGHTHRCGQNTHAHKIKVKFLKIALIYWVLGCTYGKDHIRGCRVKGPALRPEPVEEMLYDILVSFIWPSISNVFIQT